MFASSWKPWLKTRANEIVFSKTQDKLSPDIIEKYNAIKDMITTLSISIDKGTSKRKSVELCRKMLFFYTSCEELVHLLMLECFKDSFIRNVERRLGVFTMVNKIFKIMMIFDVMKLRNREIFSCYSEMRLLEKGTMNDIDEVEDNKISMLFMICIPMARMFLTMFSSPIFDLEIPCLLGKIPKLYLDLDHQKMVGLFAYLSEKHNWRYSLVFFSVLFERATGSSELDVNRNTTANLLAYLDMMKQQK